MWSGGKDPLKEQKDKRMKTKWWPNTHVFQVTERGTGLALALQRSATFWRPTYQLLSYPSISTMGGTGGGKVNDIIIRNKFNYSQWGLKCSKPITLECERHGKSWGMCVCVGGVLHSTASFSGMLSTLNWVLCSTRQLMSFPLSEAFGARRYSLVTVTVSSAPVFEFSVQLPLAVVTHLILAAGRPSLDSQRATTTGWVPLLTVTMEAEFTGLAGGRVGEKMRRWKVEDHRRERQRED